MTEHDIQNLIRYALQEKGFYTERINVGSGFMLDSKFRNQLICILRKHGEFTLAERLQNIKPFRTGAMPGRSDLSAIKNGKIYFLEVKTEKGKPSAEQLNFIKRMKELGCIAGIVRSAEDAIKLVENETEEQK